MDFYSILSKYYEEIFPLSIESLDFVMKRVPSESSLLDAGCGTGGMVRQLRQQGIQAKGFDLDESMIYEADIRLAEELTGIEKDENPVFKPGNLTDMTQLYSLECFDAVICLGNTLIHIPFNLQFQFLQDAAKLLNTRGTLILQILNYTNILDEGMTFPLIETEHCRFKRHYEPGASDGMLSFVTELEEKKTGRLFENSILHYPMMPETLMAALSMSGYAEWDTYGSYQEVSAGSGQLPLIVTAQLE
ncbi:methyltransferase domain-containing protein [Oceanispirochaeta sp.]|jgi:glycine/sarcosine N-methyltransferase|uniref:class I SAM-dependent methyltransferase n=1 Tax=Oceanispirochaeta sp. TaxID=2035350 RepID=UPI002606F481|nr:methyltransferase domain-containing protein [Oceanispirochaeta sp.]MDA3955205.1 methyltransferase domain-containing protein [Oceanispirochaeta sp.]